MRFLKCLINSKTSNDESPTIVLPKGVFNGVESDRLYLATKRKKFDYLTVWILKEKNIAKIYELYCELKLDKAIIEFIWELQEIIKKVDGALMLDINDGICKGDEDIPCTFDGFFAVKEGHNPDKCMDELMDRIKEIRIEDQLIVSKIVREEVK